MAYRSLRRVVTWNSRGRVAQSSFVVNLPFCVFSSFSQRNRTTSAFSTAKLSNKFSAACQFPLNASRTSGGPVRLTLVKSAATGGYGAIRRAQSAETVSATKPNVYTSLTCRKNAKTRLRTTRQTRCLEGTSRRVRNAAHRHSRQESSNPGIWCLIVGADHGIRKVPSGHVWMPKASSLTGFCATSRFSRGPAAQTTWLLPQLFRAVPGRRQVCRTRPLEPRRIASAGVPFV